MCLQHDFVGFNQVRSHYFLLILSIIIVIIIIIFVWAGDYIR